MVSIGFHQDASQEANLSFCRQSGIPVVRRVTGGEAVFLNSKNIIHAAVTKGSKREKFNELFSTYSKPQLVALRKMGIDSQMLKGGEVQVNGKKIGSRSAAWASSTLAVKNTLSLEFDHETAVQALNFPHPVSENASDSMKRKFTSLYSEREDATRQMAERAILDGYRQGIGIELEEGSLSEWEKNNLLEMLFKYSSPEWRNMRKCETGGKSSTLRTGEGILRVSLSMLDNTIHEAFIGGDIHAEPADTIQALEAYMRWTHADEKVVKEKVDDFFGQMDADIGSTTKEDIANAIVLAYRN